MRQVIISCLACWALGASASLGGAQTVTVIEAPMGSYVSTAYARGDKLYAAVVGGRNWGVYSFNWTARRWSRVYGPVEQIAVTDTGKLFARTKDGVISYTGEGEKWYTIGGPSRRLIAGGDKLYSIEPRSGDVYLNTGSDQWRKVGGPAEFHAADANGTLYGFGRAGLWVYSGTGEQWTQISPSGGTGLFGGGRDKIFTRSEKGALWEYDALRREWKQWTPDQATRGVVVSPDGLVAYSVTERGDTEDFYTPWLAFGPMNARKMAGGAVGTGTDCVLISLNQNDKAHIGFVKR